jgi:hypothetical protein
MPLVKLASSPVPRHEEDGPADPTVLVPVQIFERGVGGHGRLSM